MKIDEKCSRTGGFQYDLIMILDNGLLFWATLYVTQYTKACQMHLLNDHKYMSSPRVRTQNVD